MNIIYLSIVIGLSIIALNLAIYGHIKDSENFKFAGWMSFVIIVLLFVGVIGTTSGSGKDKISLIEPDTVFADSNRVIYVVNDSITVVSRNAGVVRSPKFFIVRKVQECNAWGGEVHSPKYSIVKRRKDG